ncbi:MAG: DUF3237 family protein [Aristaeellaceae bacterium]
MLVLKLRIHVLGQQEVASAQALMRMILFDGYCEGPFFCGEIEPGGVDTQTIHADGSGTLSARYMLRGTDSAGNPSRLFIENNALLGDDTTTPRIWVDSPSLRWLETASLVGRITSEQGQLVILIETQDDPI